MAINPITRKEMFMAKAAGQNVNVPEPITREEKYLAAIVASGGGGGGGQFTVALTFTENNEPMVDKTFEEIASVIESGQDVLLAQNTEGYAGFYRLNMYVGGMFVKFSNVFIDGLATTVLTCTINDNGTVSLSEQTISASGSGGGQT